MSNVMKWVCGFAATVLLAAAPGEAERARPPAAGTSGPAMRSAPVREDGNTRVLWIEGDTVHADWQGAELQRVIDEETARPCLEWYQNPATRAKASLTLKHVDPSQYEILRMQWKYLGGGSFVIVTIGKRNWYLFKTKYEPGIWRDVWLQLDLDDDQGGPLLNEDGEMVITLSVGTRPQNRAGEEAWRRIRVRDLRLVRYPVRLSCNPRDVTYLSDDNAIRTVFPVELTNATDARQPVNLFLDPARLRDFTASFEQPALTLAPRQKATVNLTFSMPRATAAAHDALYLEEAPVYAAVPGDPASVTTWYRAYVHWKPAGVVPPPRTDRPLMVEPGTRERVLERARKHPAAKAACDHLLARADKALERPVRVPELRHGYGGHHICPEHQKPVRFSLDDWHRQYCPAGKHYVEGKDHLDRAAALHVHSTNSEDCRHLGWAYYLTGDEKYARKAIELLKPYAERYPGWDYRNPQAVGYWSKVSHAVLGECWWIHGFVDGYDLIASSPSLTPQLKQRIERDLFAIAAESIQSHRVSVNQQCEINWASGGAAVDAGQWYLAAMAFGGTYGLRDQVELGFSEEGFSRENEFPYHFSALGPIVEQGRAWEAMGAEFFDANVKRLFDAPLAFSIDQRIGWTHVYETGYAQYRDPTYLRLLPERASATRLLHGVLPLPERVGAGELSNSSLERAGKSVLRRGKPEDLRAVTISWGAPTWRGGRDLLNFLAYSQGIWLNRSVTRIGYGYSIHGLSYETLGGNLPEVDGLRQTGVRPRQAAIVGGDVPAAKYVAPLTEAMYPGVRLSRVIAITGNAFVIVDRLSSDQPRRFTFSFYPAAKPDGVTFEDTGEFTPYAEFHGQGKAYGLIQEPERATAEDAFTLTWESAEGKRRQPTRARFFLDAESEVVRGRTHTGWHPFLTPVVLARRTAKSAACVMVLEATGEGAPHCEVKLLPVEMDGTPVARHEGIAVAVTGRDGSYLVLDCDRPGVKTAGPVQTSDSLWVGKLGSGDEASGDEASGDEASGDEAREAD